MLVRAADQVAREFGEMGGGWASGRHAGSLLRRTIVSYAE
jgi:hypothetical protein